ncbi:MAG: ubiquinone/menaquinone biosynthesis methyltransferase [Microthrixaceae bacterium]
MLPGRGDPLPSGDEKTAAVRSMFDTIAGRYDLVNRLMTFGMDVRWRDVAIDSLGLRGAENVLDLATGTGDMALALAERGAVPIGADLSLGMLDAARKPFPRVQCDATALPIPDAALDAATCGFALRNFTDLASTLAEVARVLRPGARIALLDVAEPPNPFMALGHSIYFNRVVPLIGGLLSDRDAYSYLPRSVAYLPPTGELLATVRHAGFESISRQLLSGGISQLITATRRAL